MDRITNSFEKHGQTIIASIVMGLVAWVGLKVSSQSTNLAVLNERVASLQQEVKVFTKQPRFSRDDFKIEMRIYESRISLLELELKDRAQFMISTDDRLRDLERNMGKSSSN